MIKLDEVKERRRKRVHEVHVNDGRDEGKRDGLLLYLDKSEE